MRSFQIKDSMTLTDWHALSEPTKHVITHWKKIYYPHEHELLTLAQALELLHDLRLTFHTNTAIEGFFNKAFLNTDSVIAWNDTLEGSSILETILYDIDAVIKGWMRHEHF